MTEATPSSAILYLVEDDDFQAESLCEPIVERFPALEMKHIATHSGFNSQFEQIASDQPVGMIIDEMLKWKNDSISAAPTDLNSYLQAGTDCRLKLLNDMRTAAIPVLIYSVLDVTDVLMDYRKKGCDKLPPGTKFLRKDCHESKLINWVKAAVDDRFGASSLTTSI